MDPSSYARVSPTEMWQFESLEDRYYRSLIEVIVRYLRLPGILPQNDGPA